MIGLGLQNDLQVCYGGKNEEFENVVNKYSVAWQTEAGTNIKQIKSKVYKR